MYSFENDYSEGASKEILKAIVKYNYEQNTGYGLDKHSENASNLIKKLINNDNVDIHFIPGGTPCNVLAIQTLKPYEAVICADTGHINVHETGAIENNGHKILQVLNEDGKIRAFQIEQVVLKHTDEHMVKPKMVFLANATELGTTYSLDELRSIREVCDKYNLYLYIDGARIGNALACTNVTFKDIASIADMFYIGGTKNGAFIGEALVIINNDLKKDFRYLIKQNCSMLAKGFFVAIEFEELLSNDLYMKNANHANDMSNRLREILKIKGIRLFVETKTNQTFAIIKNELLESMKHEFIVSPWGKYNDEETIVRFVTSWATTIDSIKAFEKFIRNN